MKKWVLLLLVAFALPSHAAESGQVLRNGELKAKPFIDAPKAAAVSANQAVTILLRQGGWAQVSANGVTGWIRLLNLRLAASGAAPATASRSSNSPSFSSMSNPASLFRTGSSGRTVTTGVKGMDEEDIRNSTPNMAEVQQLQAQGADASAARAFAARDGVKENSVEYLGKGR